MGASDSGGLKIGVLQHEPFATRTFEIDLDTSVRPLAFDIEYDTHAELGMPYTRPQPKARRHRLTA